jgi:hypothetical protein
VKIAYLTSAWDLCIKRWVEACASTPATSAGCVGANKL